jgi:hypothetical protein
MNKIFIILMAVFFFFVSCENNDALDPWGIWNRQTAPFHEDELIIRTLEGKKYYEIALSGLFLVKNAREFLYEIKDDISIVAIQGEYTRIEKHEPIEGGYLFYLIGRGINYRSVEFRDNVRLQVKMHFLNENECYFEYVSLEDEDGFSLSHFPREGVIYKRFRADGRNPRPVVTENR